MGSPVFIGFQTILVAYDASRRWLRAWSDILAGSWTQMGTVVRENTKGSAGKTWRKRAPALLRGQNEERFRLRMRRAAGRSPGWSPISTRWWTKG